MGKERIRTLNSLMIGRAVVAILVMLAHANLIIDRNMFHGIFIPGWCGVDFFFVLSGFLIYYVYSINKADGVKWLKGRFTRIYPTYWVYSSVVIAGHFALAKYGGVFVSWLSMYETGIARSLLLLPTDVAVNEMPIIPTAWTLSYEIVFYLSAISFVTHRKKLFYGITACWLVLIVLGRVFGNNGSLLLDFITSTLFLEFFMGMLVAKLSMMQVESGKSRNKIAITNLIVGLAFLAFSWIGTNIELSLVVNIDRVIKFGISFALIDYGIVNLELEREKVARRAVEEKEIKGNNSREIWKLLAASSYSLYLVHYPLLLILARLGRAAHLPSILTFIISAVVCICAGIIGCRFVEKPLTKWISEKWRGERSCFISVPLASITAALVFMVLLNPRMAVQKKLVGAFIGDSITEQGYYLRAIEKYPVKSYNFGVSGATYGECGSEIPLMCEIADTIDITPDFIFVAGGTNDWGNGTALGRRGDNTPATFYGGADLLLSGLRKRYPNTEIIVSTILQRNWTPSEEYPQPAGMDKNQDGLSIEDFNDAIIWSAHRYGCRVVDAYGESGITEGTISLYTKDGVHLNDRGGAKFADFIMTEIHTVFQRYR